MEEIRKKSVEGGLSMLQVVSKTVPTPIHNFKQVKSSCIFQTYLKYSSSTSQNQVAFPNNNI